MKTIANISRAIVATLALAIAAIMAPTAASDPMYRDAVDRHPIASSTSTSERYSDALDRHPIASSTSTSERYSDAVDRQHGIEAAWTQPLKPLNRGYDAIELARAEPVSVSAPSTVAVPGFDWRDAGIGAGASFGAILLLTAAAMLASRSRRVAHS